MTTQMIPDRSDHSASFMPLLRSSNILFAIVPTACAVGYGYDASFAGYPDRSEI
jgi:hypothetical protein